MKLKNIIRNVLPHGFVKWYISRNNQRRHYATPDDFIKRFNEVSELLKDNGRFLCDSCDIIPCIDDKSTTTPFDAHYFYHPAWAARILAKTKPALHIDISSSLNFVGLISAFVNTKFYDYRPPEIDMPDLPCGNIDIVEMPFAEGSVASLSCMHVVEHIGLERYGDKFDPQGDIKAMRQLERVLAKGGNLLFVVPVGGIQKIHYNAHRVYTYSYILDMFNNLSLVDFSLVDDKGNFILNAKKEHADRQKYGCGCFHFRKM